jgi:hypothetical protein
MNENLDTHIEGRTVTSVSQKKSWGTRMTVPPRDLCGGSPTAQGVEDEQQLCLSELEKGVRLELPPFPNGANLA